MKNTVLFAARPSRLSRLVLPALLTLLFLFLTALTALSASAAAQEPGYWSEAVDENGNVVQIFTYTQAVVPDELHKTPLDGYDGESAVPIAGSNTAAEHLAAQPVSAEEASAEHAPDSLLLPVGVGFAFLALLAFALYKAL